MQATDDCVFCRLMAGDLEASVVHEDRRTVAFMDIQPLFPAHVLVVPRGHTRSLPDLDPDEGARVFRVATCDRAANRMLRRRHFREAWPAG